jgi:hypothetical protein
MKRFLVRLVACAFVAGLAIGCTAKEDKQPKVDANAPKLKQQNPGGAGGPAQKPE